MKNPIKTNSVFDSRDLIDYKEYLENEVLEAYIEFAENHNEHKDEDVQELIIPDSLEEAEYLDEEAFTIGCNELIQEWEAIKSFVEELEGYGDFRHGETIISKNYFEEYCKDFVKDCDYISKDTPLLIQNNIDWAGIADDMKQDYMTATYEGVDYYMRS